ncbi:class I SAM-dependent methyltransferase [Candidatus Neomarinimicrobiota bacterium]
MAKYDKVVGYAAIDDNDTAKLRNTIQISTEISLPYYSPLETDNILVAGCGNGDEALLLHERFKCQVIGVDISLPVEQKQLNSQVLIQRGDLSELPFPDGYFNYIYSYHVLEHVPDHIEVLKELNRILKNNSPLFIGFPNKHRLVGYIGVHNAVSLRQKILWNLQDYTKKITGKFENSLGAHAGFTNRQFLSDAKEIFDQVIGIRDEYFDLKYGSYKSVFKQMRRLGIEEYIFPSNYYICRN